MSGIVALFQRDGRPVEPDDVRAMLLSAPYLGPDGMTARIWNHVAVGHARLAVTPEDEHDRQPLVSRRTGRVLVADVRLDNRSEIMGAIPGPEKEDASDAELILRGYDALGDGIFPRLIGDFAVIIWDPREHHLVCARDTSGQRTLFYRADGKSVALASELHQLLQDPAVPIQPNENRVRAAFVPQTIMRNDQDTHETYFDGIYSVPAGHTLVVGRDSLRLRAYWRFEPPIPIRYRSDEEYAEHFRDLFFDVIRRRLRTSRPAGALLSGGLDSSSVVCTAQQLYRAGTVPRSGFTSFSIGYEGLECDETHLIRDIQQMYGFDARIVPFSDGHWLYQANGFVEGPNMGDRMQPNGLFAIAREIGVRTMLTGAFADNCIGGQPQVFDSLLRRGRIRDAISRMRAHRRGTDESWPTILGFAVAAPLLPLTLEKLVLSAWARAAYRRHGRSWLPWWMARRLRLDLAEEQLRLQLEAERTRRFTNPAQHLEHGLLYPPDITRHPRPWPIQLNQPWSDRRLHEFLLAIPPEQKYAPEPGCDEYYAGAKRLIRQAMIDTLPESVRTRKSKTIFLQAIARDVSSQWDEYVRLVGPAATPEIVARGYVDHDRFWRRLMQLRDGHDGPDVIFLTTLIGLESWLRGFYQSRSELVTVPVPYHISQPQIDMEPEEAERVNIA